MVVSEVMRVVACGITFSAKVANARNRNNEGVSALGGKACLQKRYNNVET